MTIESEVLEVEEVELSEGVVEDDLDAIKDADDDTPAPEAKEEDKPASGYIDFNELPENIRPVVESRIKEATRKEKEFERKEAEYRRKLDAFEEKELERSKPKEVVAPTPDDFYNDPDKAAKQMADWQESVKETTAWDAQNQQRLNQAEAARKEVEQQRIQGFYGKVSKAGLEQSKVAAAANNISTKVSNDTAEYIVNHAYAPQIILALDSNPELAAEVANLSPYEVGEKLNDLAKTFKPKTKSNAPKPVSSTKGSGVNIKSNTNGFTYE